jgi:hypothetical protein
MPLTNQGRDLIAQFIVNDGPPTFFDAANARLGVGDSTTACNAAQTDLQAATNKFRKLVSGAPGRVNNVLTFIATFGAAEANFAWNEIGVFNTATANQGMLCRVVQALGTKASGDWTLTSTVTVAVGT